VPPLRQRVANHLVREAVRDCSARHAFCKNRPGLSERRLQEGLSSRTDDRPYCFPYKCSAFRTARAEHPCPLARNSPR
jgi:hypothetical protein